MGMVQIWGIERPGLGTALAARGLSLAREGAAADVLFGRHPKRGAIMPTVIEVIDMGQAAAILDAGAEDVVLATDSDCLAAARLAGVIRRVHANRIVVGDVMLDLSERRALRGGRALPLYPREFALLACLARARGELVSHDALRQLVCGLGIDPGTNVLAVHVSRLRGKLGNGAGAPRLVTQKGEGYRLLPPLADMAEQLSLRA